MKIVEYAIRIKDLGTVGVLNKVGTTARTQSQAIKGYGQQISTNARYYKLSYEELQEKIKETERIIRGSVLKSEIRTARKELALLQKQSAKRKVDVSGGGVGGSGIGSLVKGGLLIGGITAGIAQINRYGKESREAYAIQELAEQRLTTVMRQRMGATAEQINQVKQLASAEQKKGIIGDEVQLSGGQQLSTFLNKSESLKTLLPAMNNLLAQQRGINASEQDAVNIGNLMGKAMQGQTGALTRVGITFNSAQEQVLKYGNEAERAAMLAEVIKDNVGEMNQELAATDSGKLKQYANEAGDVKEQFGAIFKQLDMAIMPLKRIGLEMLQGLLPIIDSVVPAIQSGVSWITENIYLFKNEAMSMIEPLLTFWDTLKANSSGLLDYVMIIGEFIQSSILPAIKKISTTVFGVIGGMIRWISQSQLIKDLFNGVVKIFSSILELIGWVVDKLMWLWDNVIMPILNAIEKVYGLLKGGGKVNVETKTNGKGGVVKVEGETAMEKNTKAIDSLSGAMKENSHSAATTESAISGGGAKTITFNISKFFDTITVHSGSVGESTAEIESKILECFARIVNNGAITAMR